MLVEAVLVLVLLAVAGHIFDYRILKGRVLREKWDLNICCGKTDCGGINADVVPRRVRNFVLVDIYRLPFRDGQFNRAVCSHTMEHVDNPEMFYLELKRVSKSVTLLVPPVWDIAAVAHVPEHKWQFLTLRSRHDSSLPRMVKLPYWWYHRMFGQRME